MSVTCWNETLHLIMIMGDRTVTGINTGEYWTQSDMVNWNQNVWTKELKTERTENIKRHFILHLHWD